MIPRWFPSFRPGRLGPIIFRDILIQDSRSQDSRSRNQDPEIKIASPDQILKYPVEAKAMHFWVHLFKTNILQLILSKSDKWFESYEDLKFAKSHCFLTRNLVQSLTGSWHRKKTVKMFKIVKINLIITFEPLLLLYSNLLYKLRWPSPIQSNKMKNACQERAWHSCHGNQL